MQVGNARDQILLPGSITHQTEEDRHYN